MGDLQDLANLLVGEPREHAETMSPPLCRLIISYVVGVEFVLQQLGRAGYAGPEFASTVCHEAQDTMAAKANKFAITAWRTIQIGNI